MFWCRIMSTILVANQSLSHQISQFQQLRTPLISTRESAFARSDLRVGIDARTWSLGAGTGIATYARTLGESLYRAGVQVQWLTGGVARRVKGGAPRERAVSRWGHAIYRGVRTSKMERHEDTADVPQCAHDGGRLFREAQSYFTMHGDLMRLRCDSPPQVMHWTYPLPLYLEGATNVYTVHDLIPLTHPRLTGIDSERHRRLLQKILSQAAHVVTVSDTSRDEILKTLGCADTFVTNTSQAIRAPLQRDPPLPAGLRPGGYFICCGMPEPRKNIPRLVAAYRTALASRVLVIAGPVARDIPQIESMLARSPGVIRLPKLARPDLIALIRQARAMLFPSLAEGFGLPVAEAMALGTPVMTSNVGALHETGGGQALHVDPHDVHAMAKAIRALDTDDMLCRRLRLAGFEQAGAFSVGDYANRLVSLYAKLCDVHAAQTT